MTEPKNGKRRSRQDVFKLINEGFRATTVEETAELRREAKAKAEEQRRKNALLTQMYSGWKQPNKEDAARAEQIPSSRRGRTMQASVETDAEESPGTDERHDCNKDTASPSAPQPKQEPPPPSLEKREGGYSHAPPLSLAREQVVTSMLCVRPPKPAAPARQNARPTKKAGGVAVWYGDEVRIVDIDPDDPGRALRPRARAHRRTF